MFKEYKEMEKNMQRPIPGKFKKDGEVLQCNQGGYEWAFNDSEDKTCCIFELSVPKFMDTSLVDVDLQPTFVRCDVKGKITQLKFPDEILVEKSTVQRSLCTGKLSITCPKADITEIEARAMRMEKRQELMDKNSKLRDLEIKQEAAIAKKKDDRKASQMKEIK